jgi:hypothetical protein
MAATHVQHVNILWLSDSAEPAQVRELFDAADGLASIPGVLAVHAGPRTATSWPGPEDTFSYGLAVSFESAEAIAVYHAHPAHQRFADASRAVLERFQSFFFDC